ncbi:MAG: GGDEF domain-containing protein [Desulfobacterales bacterium]|nr:GGDEF domain-containing protein [Desulfobacterales bacterium]
MLDYAYPDSIEDTGNFLRIALKEMTRHKLPYNPISYTIWYEYASGRNLELIREIQSMEARGETVPFDVVLQWFRQYVSDRQTVLAEQKTQEFKSILNDVTTQLDDSGARMDDQGTRLESYTNQLDDATAPEDIQGISRDIVSEAQNIIMGSNALKQDVNDTISELNALKQELEGLRHEAKTDMLTGLLNRRGFEEAVAKATSTARQNNTPLTLIIADIDHFKKVNDTYGHLIGDNVLKMLSNLIKEHIKGKDIASRFGGEEFIIVLPETDLKGGSALAEHIRTSLESMRWRTKQSGKAIGAITISLGIAQYAPGENLDTLIQRADNALYTAKQNGRNQTVTQNDAEALTHEKE